MPQKKFRPEVGFVGRLGSGPLAQDDPDGTLAEICVHATLRVLEMTGFLQFFTWCYPLAI